MNDLEYELASDSYLELMQELENLNEELESLISNNDDGGLDEDIALIQQYIVNVEQELKREGEYCFA